MGWRLVLKRSPWRCGRISSIVTNRHRKEAALLVPVFLLRTGLLLAEVVDELSRDDLDIVLRARKWCVDVDSFRGVGAPPLMKKDERVAILQRRQKTLLRVWRTLHKKRDWLRDIYEDSGPKLLEGLGRPSNCCRRRSRPLWC